MTAACHCNLITVPVSYNIIVFYSDISSLAKAAVAGDEAALDMLSWRKSSKSTSNTSSDYSFFFGVTDGKFILTRVFPGLQSSNVHFSGKQLISLFWSPVVKVTCLFFFLCLTFCYHCVNLKTALFCVDITLWGIFNKLTSVFMRLSSYWSWISSSHCQSSCGSADYLDNVMTKFIVNDRTGA